MKEPWKKFVEENQEGFNDESPKDVFFEKIAPALKKENSPRMIRLSTVISLAAAFVLLTGLTLFFFLYERESENAKGVVASKEKKVDDRLVLAKVNPELAETEFYYVSQIDQLMEEVETNQLTTEVKAVLEQLDTEFNLLKKEMGDHVNSDQIIAALMENYRLKIKLLEKLLNTYHSNEENNEKEIHT